MITDVTVTATSRKLTGLHPAAYATFTKHYLQTKTLTLKQRICRILTQQINTIDSIATRPIHSPTIRIIVFALFIIKRQMTENKSLPDICIQRYCLTL